MSGIKDRLSDDLRAALKERGVDSISAIRSLIAAIDNAGAVMVTEPQVMPMSGGIAGAANGVGSSEVPRRHLSDNDIKQIIQKEIDGLEQTISLLKSSQSSVPKNLFNQINTLKRYL